VPFWAPPVGLEPSDIARTIQLKIIGCYFERLRCLKKCLGAGRSSIFSTAAPTFRSLLLPQAAVAHVADNSRHASAETHRRRFEALC